MASVALGLSWPDDAHAQTQVGSTEPAAASGPIRLRQPQQPQDRRAPTPLVDAEPQDPPVSRDFAPGAAEQPLLLPRAYRPGEFERYVQVRTNDRTIRRFGAELVVESAGRGAGEVEAPAAVPPDYALAPGDELVLTIWGSVEADLRLVVDRAGLINVPRVGSIMVAGSRYADVGALIRRQMARTFRNFELSVSLGQLRGVRVFVTGFAAKPGAYSVSSLSTVSSVLFGKAGGPAAAGSFRNIELRRDGKPVARFDLYDLLALGQRQGDETLRAGDVIHVGPVGSQVALIGSVNKAAVYELMPGETVAHLLRISGGLSSVADPTRLAVERLDERNDKRVRELALPAEAGITLSPGDVVRAFSAIDVQLPLERQNKRVRVEGEVARPGEYILPPGSSVADALKAAGGTTANAYLFGTEFSRDTVRQTQQVNYERALRDLELEIAKRGSAVAAKTAEEATAQAAQQLSSDRLVQRLRSLQPSGRIVLQLAPNATALPDLALEDGDRITIPAIPSTVGVFGSVFNAGSYLYAGNRSVADYLRLAGSTTRGADDASIFVVRANGSVASSREKKGWLGFGGDSAIGEQAVLPGDTVFVPEELNKTTFVQAAKDWTQILYQFGIGLAAITTITK